MSSELDLGPCCVCGKSEEIARNIIVLEQKSPIAGRGWGCVQCDLPSDGASAVVCDSCFESPGFTNSDIKLACGGYPASDGRVPIEELKGIHDHNLLKHDELSATEVFVALRWFKDSPDQGPDCVCSACVRPIAVADFLDEETEPDIPVRMWNGKNEEARFHTACFTALMERGVINLVKTAGGH